MKILRPCFFAFSVLMAFNTNAQRSPAGAGLSKYSISFGIGMASYQGDLIQNSRLFNKPGYAFSGALSYDLTKKIAAKLNFGVQKIRAADSDNKGAQYKARNLSFNAKLIDMSVGAEYTILDLNKHKLSPFVNAGFGAVFFYPYVYDAAGKKQNLRELRTEGQKQPYEQAAFAFPLGAGVKYALNEAVTLKLEFSYRITSTDYLDDVSSNYYPDKALLDARNPVTAKFTWRGNEVGGEAYPANRQLPRGNPKDNDGYYTTEFKIAFKF